MYTIVTEVPVTTIQRTEKTVTLAEFIGFNIRTLREARKSTPNQFLNYINLLHEGEKSISITHYKNIEKGLSSMRLGDLELICEGLDVPVHTLFTPPTKLEA